MSGAERRLEEIRRVLDNLADELRKGTLAVVEGQKDIRTMTRLGATGNIIAAKTSGKGLLDVLREIEKQGGNEVILLMDFDRRGKEWTSRISRHLEAMRIRPNLVFWRELLSLAGGEVKDIEGLAAYVETLEEKIGKNILNVGE